MKIQNGPIDGVTGESGGPSHEGNSSSPQLFCIESSDKMLLTLIQMRKQDGVFLHKFVGRTHTNSIAE
jgi:hypothetical protein